MCQLTRVSAMFSFLQRTFSTLSWRICALCACRAMLSMPCCFFFCFPHQTVPHTQSTRSKTKGLLRHAGHLPSLVSFSTTNNQTQTHRHRHRHKHRRTQTRTHTHTHTHTHKAFLADPCTHAALTWFSHPSSKMLKQASIEIHLYTCAYFCIRGAKHNTTHNTTQQHKKRHTEHIVTCSRRRSQGKHRSWCSYSSAGCMSFALFLLLLLLLLLRHSNAICFRHGCVRVLAGVWSE